MKCCRVRKMLEKLHFRRTQTEENGLTKRYLGDRNTNRAQDSDAFALESR